MIMYSLINEEDKILDTVLTDSDEKAINFFTNSCLNWNWSGKLTIVSDTVDHTRTVVAKIIF